MKKFIFAVLAALIMVGGAANAAYCKSGVKKCRVVKKVRRYNKKHHRHHKGVRPPYYNHNKFAVVDVFPKENKKTFITRLLESLGQMSVMEASFFSSVYNLAVVDGESADASLAIAAAAVLKKREVEQKMMRLGMDSYAHITNTAASSGSSTAPSSAPSSSPAGGNHWNDDTTSPTPSGGEW